MSLPTIFEICVPRQDVVDGTVTEAEFAADLAAVLRGEASEEYREPAKFFARTYPTEGLRDLLQNVCARLSGAGDSVAHIFRLDTNYGGGKTHALIALTHAAVGMKGVANVAEFVDSALLPKGPVRVAAFDGENADPNNGRPLGDGIRAYTPWGELAHSLAGPQGYETVRRSDEGHAAPGADTIKELFGGEPTLILLDELAVYLRKLRPGERDRSGGQLTAFLTGLFKAVESTPNAAVVYTLAIGKTGRATDAYASENEFIADAMAEAESVSARTATLLDPTAEDETVKVLRRRLFEDIDDARAAKVIDAYRELWTHHEPLLPPLGASDEREESFSAGYPLHPELMDTLRNKTATLGNFQRVRGMLRLLGRTVGQLWELKPKDAYAFHLHHLDAGFAPVRQEIVTRLEQRQFVPALRADVAAVEGDEPALAQQINAQHYGGQPPYGSYVARVMFFHSLAFQDQLKGATKEQLRYSIVSPGTDIAFIDDAITRFSQSSAYLDDRPNVPYRFLAEANLTQIIRRQEERIDKAEARQQLNDRIREIFRGDKVFNPFPFPGGPYEVPDDSGDGKPALVIIGYDAADIAGDTVKIPELVEKIYQHHGSRGATRKNRNNLVFVLAEASRKEDMRRRMVRRLALHDLLRPERLDELAPHQQDKMRELARRSEQELALAIQQCYRHLLYPSRDRVEGAEVDLAHAAIEVHTASQTPGDGQKHVIQVLRESRKLRLPEDDPDSPSYIRDRTPLRKGQITTAALRAEYRRDPTLPMLVGDDVFLRGLRQGIETGEYVYQSGDLIWAEGMPNAAIKIDEQSVVYTAACARDQGVWPRPEPSPAPPPKPGDAGEEPPGPEIGGDEGDEKRTPGFEEGDAAVVTEEGPLKEALTKLWEKARDRKFGKVGSLMLKPYDTADGFRVMALVSRIPKATKTATIAGGYETTENGELHIEFNGPIGDAQPVKDFLEPQLRAAKEKDLELTLTVRFSEGLDLSGDEPERLTERLGKFGGAAAYVSATAAAEGAGT